METRLSCRAAGADWPASRRVWMVPYFAVEDTGELEGVIPDLGRELARRLGVPCDLLRIKNLAGMIAAFRDGAIDATFIGITADRAAEIDFGPMVIGIQTTFLVPGQSPIKTISEVDSPGVRIAVPQDSAQAAELANIMTKARLVPVPAESPAQAVDMLAAGETDAFSHVAPMLASVQGTLPGSRILPGSYFDVRSPSAAPRACRRPPPRSARPSPPTSKPPVSSRRPSRAWAPAPEGLVAASA